MSVVGIDLGFQSCFIAVARQGGIEVVANEFSDRNTPAYVAFGEKERTFGNTAKQQIVTNSKNTIWGWKKLIGRQMSDPKVQYLQHVYPYELVASPTGSVGVQINYLGGKQVLTMQQINTAMLTKLKFTAETALKTKVVDCVLNVPCYFTDVERRTLLDSAAAAGFNVLRLMNDTAATALSYGIYKQDLPAPEEKSTNIAFVDMGHSDLQVSICAFNKGKLKMLACGADPNLGGFDFDNVLVKYFTEEFKKKYKVDAGTSVKARLRLLNECEKLKKLMSANSTELPLNLECFMDDKDVSGRLNRAQLEALSGDLIERIHATLQYVLSESKLSKEDIAAVEIVGGSTRVPAVKQAVKHVFGKEPSTTLNADEAVARGCALQCAILSPTFRVRDFSITDVQPYPITLRWEGTSMDEENEMEIFERFHQAPFSKMLTFYRSSNFTLEAKYSHLQDIPYPDTAIGEFTVLDVKPQEGEQNAKVKVKVRVNIHGIFAVSSAARVEKHEKEVEAPKETKKADDKKKEEPMDVDAGASNGEAKQNGAEQDAAAQEAPKETAEPQTAAAAEPSPSKEPEKKTKIVTKSVDLPVSARVPSLSADELNVLLEQELHMISQDKLEKERADAKNAVEEYVYDMRDKISSTFEAFTKEAEREQLSRVLTNTEDWLYDEGEDEKKQVYIDKLNELKALGNPITLRYTEAQTRPAACDSLGKALMLVRKAVEAYDAGDEKYNHIEKADMDKVKTCLQEKTEWYDRLLQSIHAMKPQDDPTTTTAQIKAQQVALDSACKSTLNKPKPKPKEEPPKEKSEAASGSNDASTSANGADGDGQTSKDATNGSAAAEDDDKDMELD